MTDEPAWVPYLVMAFIVGVPALAGTSLIIAAVVRWNKLRALHAGGRQTTARVVDNQMESWSEGRTSFRPVVAFRTDTGQEVTTALADMDEFRSHLVGTEIPVFYDPEKPSEATPAKRPGGRFVATLAFGVIFLVFAVCAYQMIGTAFEFADFPG
jgi:hypothetical protein